MKRLRAAGARTPTLLVFLTLACLSASCQPEATVTEDSVRGILRTLDEAILHKDADAVAALLSDDFSGRVVSPGMETPQIRDIGRREYVRQLRLYFRSSDPMDRGRSNLTVEISSDRRSAQATSTVRITATTRGQLERRTTQETVSLELYGKELLIRSIRSFEK